MDFSTPDFVEIALHILDAVKGSNWSLVVALVLVCVVLGVRKFLASKVPFLSTDAGGVVLTFALAALGAAVNAFLAGAVLDKTLVLTALGIAWKASGGYTAIKKLIVDPLLRRFGKEPK